MFSKMDSMGLWQDNDLCIFINIDQTQGSDGISSRPSDLADLLLKEVTRR